MAINYFQHPLWGGLDPNESSEFPLIAPSSQNQQMQHSSSPLFARMARAELQRALLATQQQLQVLFFLFHFVLFYFILFFIFFLSVFHFLSLFLYPAYY